MGFAMQAGCGIETEAFEQPGDLYGFSPDIS
jgi:hypothetical protein